MESAEELESVDCLYVCYHALVFTLICDAGCVVQKQLITFALESPAAIMVVYAGVMS